MDDLVAFISAALDEDERVAVEAERGFAEVPDRGEAFAVDAHIARWDPARVLAEVAAKREILRLHEWQATHPKGYRHDAAMATIRALAQPLSGRPGWRPEWAVEVEA